MIIALLISLFLLLGMPLMGQNPPIALPTDGDWPTVVGDSIMLIGPKQEALTEEQRYFNPPYLLVYPGKEHLKNDMIRAALCDCDPTKPNRRIGVFSVAPDKQVSFSQGNLQYLPAANIWKFANTQYEYLGNANKYLKPTFRNWVDLFGWSANNTTAPFGVSTSTNAADYAGNFVDWGTNTICGDAPNTWRTLNRDEWEYLLNGRENASQLRFRAQVNNVNGFVFLPDQWICPEGIELNIEQLTTQVFTLDAWSKIENAGAVFLPAAGRLNDKQLVNFDDHGNYWSSTRINNNYVDYLAFTFSSNKLYVDHQLPIYRGRSVRLVHDTIVPIPEYVDLGLSVKWATFNVGATAPEDYGDYFAWGETEPKETYSWATYKWCDGTSTNMTKYNAEDGKTILDPEDDAAQVHWGDKWRMPTDAERDELVENCTWTWTTQNSVNGYKVTGPNGNSIFLPAGGYKGSGPDYPVGEDGLYWLGNVYKNSYAYLFTIQHEVTPPSTEGKQGTRCFGFMIRPIYDDRPPKRIGVFSVAADKQVSFSQGNLQYTQSTDEWRFAREQYEYIGAANINDGKLADRIDLFGWSANNTTAPFGISTSTNDADYTGEFVDWGTNTICGEAPGIWRTLSADEWEYLLKKRKNASDLYGVAQVAGVNGMIILPDDWEEANGIVFKSGLHSSQVNDYSVYQSFTDVQWLAMENAGAVFLPALGYRDGTNVEKCNTSGYYWSNTTSDEKSASRLYFYSYFLAPNDVHSKYRGRSVRLVHDTIVPTPEPEYVDLGLSVKWATFNVGATSPEDYGDYFAWGETEPKETYSWTNYKWCDGTSTNMTKYNAEDGKTILEPEDDAAQVHWGGNWRMPTEEEQQELIDRCSWERTNLNGVIGYKVTGPNGNSIFIPIAGAYNSFDDQLNSVGSIGWIYSSTIATEIRAYEIHIEEGGIQQKNCSRCVGLTIRPVYDDRPDPCIVVKVNDTLSINMMCVEGGTFTMRKGEDEHPVSLFDYSIGQTEVTQALWEAVMGTNPSANTANKQLPVIKISWYDCQEFIKKLNQQTGMRFRLPTEAEWEYAARGGQKSKGYTYAGSNDLKEVAWYNGNSGNRLHAVAQKKPNELGIYDMSGNAWEWCEDYYDTDETMHVVKSGSFYDYESACRIDSRTGRAADYKSFIGLRLVLDERSTPPEPEYVDLGLSVKWATFNVGATAPEEIGDFYAWGETEPKDSYSVGNYKWWNGSSQEITKYCTFDTIAYGGIADGLTELQQQDDVAHILKGEHWRMPNLDECKELVNGCTWTVSTRQGQIGFEGTSKINGNTIFLPVAGFRAGANLVHETLGGYWSSTLNIEKQSCAMGLYLNRETPTVNIYYNSSRQNGFLIRPVYDDRP